MFIYDNPDTNCRELYSRGHLITFYTEAEVDYTVRNRYTQNRHDFIRIMYEKEVIKHGSFKEGAEYGDERDKPVDPLATQIYEE